MSLGYHMPNDYAGIPESIVAGYDAAGIGSRFFAKPRDPENVDHGLYINDDGNMTEKGVNDYLAKLSPEQRKSAEKFLRAVLKQHQKSRKKGGKQ